jgi:hypothetical protein
MSLFWFAPVAVLLLGLVAVGLLTRSVDRELALVRVEQGRWRSMAARLAHVRSASQELGVGGRDLGRR